MRKKIDKRNIENIFRVILNEKLPLDEGAYVELKNSSLHNLNKFSVCGSFKTKQFLDIYRIKDANKEIMKYSCHTIFSTSNFFLMSVVQSYEKTDEQGNESSFRLNQVKAAKKKWVFLHSKVFKEDIQSEIWKPRIWNNFCLKVNMAERIANLTLNSALIHVFKFDEEEKIDEENIKLMNFFFQTSETSNSSCPFYGSLTNFNVWNSIIDDVDSNNLNGNVVSLDTASLVSDFRIANAPDYLISNKPYYETLRYNMELFCFLYDHITFVCALYNYYF